MPIDESWVSSQKAWVKGQSIAIEQLTENNKYNLKEIELHEKIICVNNEIIAHYENGVKDAQETLDNHIKENS